MQTQEEDSVYSFQVETSDDEGYSPRATDRFPTSLGVLESASDFEINGGSISSIGRDSTSFAAKRDVHVNIHHHHSPPIPSLFPQSSGTTSSLSVPLSILCQDLRQEDASSTHASFPPQYTTRPTEVIQRNCDIYRNHLAAKGRGIPLYIPEPSQNLPIQYQRKGISMGDVGVITPSGGFLFLFNIFLQTDDPINPGIMPEGFKPLRFPHGFDAVSSQRVFKDNSYLASPSKLRAKKAHGTANLIFESSEHRGAILTMPVGAKTADLPRLVHLRRYVTTNLQSWYRYAYLDLGIDIQNGDLKIVTGCEKASAWGMACLGQEPDSSWSRSDLGSGERQFYLEFGPTGLNNSGRGGRYEWGYEGAVAEVRAGPDLSEVAQLRLAAGGQGEGEIPEEGTEHYENQCLFLRTMNPTLPPDTWQAILLEEADNPGDDEEDEEQEEGGLNEERPGVYRRYGHSPSLNTRNGNLLGSSSRATVSQTGVIPLDMSDILSVLSARSMSFAGHPSIAINKYLLAHCPDETTIPVSLDHDWISVLRKDDETLPSSEVLLKRILESYPIRQEEGVIFFDSKQYQSEVEDETDFFKSLSSCQKSKEDHLIGGSHPKPPGLSKPLVPPPAVLMDVGGMTLFDVEKASIILDNVVESEGKDIGTRPHLRGTKKLVQTILRRFKNLRPNKHKNDDDPQVAAPPKDQNSRWRTSGLRIWSSNFNHPFA